MENKANYALIGVFVLLAFLGFIAFIAYISGKQFDEEYNEYVVVYTTPPRGITVGSEVHYNGIIMGEVTKTELDKTNPKIVLVHIRVQADTPVLKQSFAQSEPLGLTGLSYIQLFAGPSIEPLEPSGPKDKPRIEGKGSQLDSLLGGGESVIENVNMALVSASNVLNPKAAEDLHSILSNINAITGSIRETNISEERVEEFLGVFEQAARDFSGAATAIETAANDASALMGGDEIKRVLARTESTIATAEKTLLAYEELAKKGGGLSDDARSAVQEFRATGLQDVIVAIAELRALTESLNRVSSELERSPIEFIAGEKKETMEIRQ